MFLYPTATDETLGAEQFGLGPTAVILKQQNGWTYGMTFGFNTETTYDWQNEQGTVPLNWTVQQLLKLGTQPLSVQLGARYYAENPLVARNGVCDLS